MAQLPRLQVSDNWFGRLNAGIDSSVTTCVVREHGGANLNVITIVAIGTEKILVTDIDYDTPSAGLATLTIERGHGGTAAAAHLENAVVAHLFFEDFFQDAMARLHRLERWARARVGDQNGIIRVGATALQVAEAGTPDMTVSIAPGAAVVDGQPTALVTEASVSFVAPVTYPRIDVVQLEQNGTITVVTGAEDSSPVAPAATGLKLAELALTTSTTEIENADITDRRSYL